jgi:hypothetical protein
MGSAVCGCCHSSTYLASDSCVPSSLLLLCFQSSYQIQPRGRCCLNRFAVFSLRSIELCEHIPLGAFPTAICSVTVLGFTLCVRAELGFMGWVSVLSSTQVPLTLVGSLCLCCVRLLCFPCCSMNRFVYIAPSTLSIEGSHFCCHVINVQEHIFIC